MCDCKKTWIAENMCEKFAAAFSDAEKAIIASALNISEQLEEYTYLCFKNYSIVVSLAHPHAEEVIFNHYNERGIRFYGKYVSKANLPGYELPLQISKVGFTSATDAQELVPMPDGLLDKLIPRAKENDEIQYEFLPGEGNCATLCFAWKNVPKCGFLSRFAMSLRHQNLVMGDVKLAYLDALTAKSVLVGMVGIEGENLKKPEEVKRIIREIELTRNMKLQPHLQELVEKKTITVNQAVLLRALAALVEQILTEVDAAMYTEDAILEAMFFHPELTVEFIRMFKAKFHPKSVNIELYAQLKTKLEEQIAKLDTGRKKHDDRRRAVFTQLINVTDHILRTNAYSYERLGTGFRVDPKYLDHVPGFNRAKKFPELPFGLFFVRGATYMGMQIRFRDLARGGMRTVIAWDAEHERYERPNMFTECYNLAFTQQKKNKDIPEGGSKSICFLNPNSDLARDLAEARREMLDAGKTDVDAAIEKLRKDISLEYMYSNQRCYLTTLLKLIVWDYEKECLKYGEGCVDYYKTPEYIYLGPDENFHDYLIEWLAAKSAAMGNFVRGAFISGKEETGINHKEFGVTSWGCFNFLVEALKFFGMDGKDFTVKLTGGPDGDVAGNFIKLLAKYYPEKSHLLMITDASGTCYDPEGFNYPALCEMFNKVQPLACYPPELLHEGAWILCIRKTRQVDPLVKEVLRITKKDGKLVEEWVHSSQAFHIYGTNAHTTKADVFLPCGGRPRSLNMFNVEDFFIDGKPTAGLIVEGANLYTTQEARDYLEDRGVFIFRDSSANKCGVVSSSYEILGGLSLDNDQFVKIKKTLAENILVRLEFLAKAEAKCMIDYYVKVGKKVHMSHVSELVSKKINQFTDELSAYLAKIDLKAPENKKLLDIFINYVPECIRKDYLDQAMVRVPDMHKKAIIATTIACDLVYKRGLDWIPTIPDILPTIL